MGVEFTRMHADHQLGSRVTQEPADGANDHLRHGARDALAPEREAVAQYIGCQQRHGALVQPQRLAHLRTAAGGGLLPLAGKVPP